MLATDIQLRQVSHFLNALKKEKLRTGKEWFSKTINANKTFGIICAYLIYGYFRSETDDYLRRKNIL